MTAPPDITVATFNVSLSPNTEAALPAMLANPGSVNPKKIAEIIQRVAPDDPQTPDAVNLLLEAYAVSCAMAGDIAEA